MLEENENQACDSKQEFKHVRGKKKIKTSRTAEFIKIRRNNGDHIHSIKDENARN